MVDIVTNSAAQPMYIVGVNGQQISSFGGTATLPAGTDRSGTIATASTAQEVAPANASRQSLTLQNASDTVMVVSENGSPASATNGYQVAPGAAISVSTNRSISIFCTVAGKRFAATEI